MDNCCERYTRGERGGSRRRAGDRTERRMAHRERNGASCRWMAARLILPVCRPCPVPPLSLSLDSAVPSDPIQIAAASEAWWDHLSRRVELAVADVALCDPRHCKRIITNRSEAKAVLLPVTPRPQAHKTSKTRHAHLRRARPKSLGSPVQRCSGRGSGRRQPRQPSPRGQSWRGWCTAGWRWRGSSI